MMRGNWTRREWLAALAATVAACTAEAPPAAEEPAKAPERAIGLNLYTVRGPVAEEPERVLRELAAIGCRYVEGRLSTEQYETELDRVVGLA